MNGWFRLHRKLVDSRVFADAHMLQLWVWILCKANHKRVHVPMTTGRGETIVTLDPGQVIVGRKTASEALGWKETTFRDRLAKLESWGCIARQPATHWTIVNVVNWGLYQRFDDTETPGNPPPNRQPTANQPPQEKNNKNYKNEKKKERSAVASLPLPFESDGFKTAWWQYLQMRSEIGKPLKPTGAKAALKKLAGWGEPRSVAALEHTVANQWQGIFEPNGGNASAVATKPAQSIPDASEVLARQKARREARMRQEANQ